MSSIPQTTLGSLPEEHHKYNLAGGQSLVFMKLDKDGSRHEGTTNEEVITMLVHRLNQLNKSLSCRENSLAITKLEEALMWLNKRTENRKARGVEGIHAA